jgi:hypothetical protein
VPASSTSEAKNTQPPAFKVIADKPAPTPVVKLAADPLSPKGLSLSRADVSELLASARKGIVDGFQTELKRQKGQVV